MTVILHIDEQFDLPDGIVGALRREGYELLQTDDAEEAIRLVEERRPALVLMEIEFTGCDGPDLLAGIRAPERGDLPVIVMTRSPRHSPLHGEAIILGAVDFLTKPVLGSELLNTIRAAAPPPPQVDRPREKRKPSPSGSAGNLSGKLLPELLARLHRKGATGVLTVRRGKSRVGVQLRNGTVVAVASARRQAYRDDLSALSEEEVSVAISRRAEAQLFEAFGWTEGIYRFDRRRRFKSTSVLEVSRDTVSLLLAGMLETAPVEHARDWLYKRSTLYICAAAEVDEVFETLGLTPPQEQALANLGGEDTLGDLLDSCLFEERLLYGLCIAGRVELHTEPMLTLTDEFLNQSFVSQDSPRADVEEFLYEETHEESYEEIELDQPVYEEPDREESQPDDYDYEPNEATREEPHFEPEEDAYDDGEEQSDEVLEEDDYEASEEEAYEESEEEAYDAAEEEAYEDTEEESHEALEEEYSKESEEEAYDAAEEEAYEDAEEESHEALEEEDAEESEEEACDAAEEEAYEDTEEESHEALEEEDAEEEAYDAAEEEACEDAEEEPHEEEDYDVAEEAAYADAEEEPLEALEEGELEELEEEAYDDAEEEADDDVEDEADEEPEAGLPDESRDEAIAAAPDGPVSRERAASIMDRIRPAGGLAVQAKSKATLVRPRVGRSGESTALEACLRAIASKVLSSDDFAVLDLSSTATDAQVREAYERALDEIPDTDVSGATQELRDLAGRVRHRIDAAYEHLKQSETRQAHVELREEEEQDEADRTEADRSIEAETWFRKGKGLLESNKYEKAGEAFGMASHLDPDEGDYLSHLGYALYLSNPSDTIVQREAMEQIARGIKSSPDRELSYVYLGRILQTKGETETARKVFKKALSISPDCHAANQSLRLLEMREEKSKGLLGRLMKR